MPFGPGATLLEVQGNAHAVCARLQHTFRDVIAVATSDHVLVEHRQDVADILRAAAEAGASAGFTPTDHTIPVIYDGEDLPAVAAATGLTAAQVVQAHASAHYTVDFMGFLPGFGYLRGLPEALVTPRRQSPRARVTRHAVGIAGVHTGVYPLASPGGWNLIGRAVGPALFDAGREPPTLLNAGDRVRFMETDRDASLPSPPVATPAIPRRGLCIEKPGICVTVQDGGRPYGKSMGLPPSGSWDQETLHAANRAVGNAPDEAALEIPQGGFRARALGSVTLSLDGEPARLLRDGDVLEVTADGRAVHCLAVQGGVDVPSVLESRSTLVLAELGGFLGRALQRGDVLGVADRVAGVPVTSEVPPYSSPAVLNIHAGPHAQRFADHAMDVLLRSTFTVSRLADRVGTRLDGPHIPRSGPDLARPIPMRRGAMQVTSDGQPVILGPDHPVTGGYPVLGVLDVASQALLARLPAGHAVQFRGR